MVSTLKMLKAADEQAFQMATEQEIGASVQCMSCRDEKPCILVSFDVFNRNRKWSNSDIELLGLIGTCIGRMLML